MVWSPIKPPRGHPPDRLEFTGCRGWHYMHEYHILNAGPLVSTRTGNPAGVEIGKGQPIADNINIAFWSIYITMAFDHVWSVFSTWYTWESVGTRLCNSTCHTGDWRNRETNFIDVLNLLVIVLGHSGGRHYIILFSPAHSHIYIYNMLQHTITRIMWRNLSMMVQT